MLGGGIELELARAGPAGHAPADHGADAVEVAGDAFAREGLLHHPAVVEVFVEVKQHKTTMEERADEILPPALRHGAIAVHHHRLDAVAAEDADEIGAEDP